MTAPEIYPEDRPRAATIRSRLMLEVASELVGSESWEPKQARVDLRAQGATEWEVSLFASDGVDGLSDVLAGRCHFAIINPASAVRSGVRRLTGSDDVPLSAIATIPSFDQLGLAVPSALGLATVADLVQAKPSLTLSLRGARPNHSVHLVLEDLFAVHGVALADFEAWGGELRYDEGLPHTGRRAVGITGGEVNAVFDEGVYNWVEMALEQGLRFLAVDEQALLHLGQLGYRSGLIGKDRFPNLPEDVVTVDFSGFLVYTRSDTERDIVQEFCRALESRADRIPWQGGGQLSLAAMVSDQIDAPITIPLHPAARVFWEARGHLTTPLD